MLDGPRVIVSRERGASEADVRDDRVRLQPELLHEHRLGGLRSALREVHVAQREHSDRVVGSHAEDLSVRSGRSGNPTLSCAQGGPTVDGNLGPLLDAASGPVHANHWSFGRLAQADEDARVVRRRVAPVGTRAAPEGRPGVPSDLNPRAEHGTAIGARKADPDPVVTIADLIHQQAHRSVEIAHKHVDIAVVVDVPKRRAQADLRQFEHHSRLVRHILEPPVAEVAEQQVALVVWKRLVEAFFRRFDRTVER